MFGKINSKKSNVQQQKSFQIKGATFAPYNGKILLTTGIFSLYREWAVLVLVHRPTVDNGVIFVRDLFPENTITGQD